MKKSKPANASRILRLSFMGMFGGCRELRETDVVLVATVEPFCCLLDLGAKQLRVSQVPSILLAGKS
jgi:hypothetical protein